MFGFFLVCVSACACVGDLVGEGYSGLSFVNRNVGTPSAQLE